MTDLVERLGVHIRPDPARVVTQLFIAGEEVTTGASRATTVLRRVLALDDGVVDAQLAGVLHGFGGRHQHLTADLMAHFAAVSDRVGPVDQLSVSRRMLLGAYATSEYAIEAASVCNPSIVAHPDQTGLPAGHLRFVLSLRAIGEGHISSIEFRTGTVDAAGGVSLDDPGPFATTGRAEHGPYDRRSFGRCLEGPDADLEVADSILDGLPPTFGRPELEASIGALRRRTLQRASARSVVEQMLVAADNTYRVTFAETTALAQRVLRPVGPSERVGMEDARFVRFTDDDGSVTYHATYTAFDGSAIAPQLLSTDDFVTFAVTQLAGRAATNKGMALFPRRIGGRFHALSRWDRETIGVTTSDDLRTWDDVTEVYAPREPWELVQVGNCGSPIETEQGWLVLTHGVGPMRTYCLGAVLLDLDDPARELGRLVTPLLRPDESERDGYVPNVVYSCGAMVHAGILVLPYAMSDQATRFARVPLVTLLGALLRT